MVYLCQYATMAGESFCYDSNTGSRFKGHLMKHNNWEAGQQGYMHIN